MPNGRFLDLFSGSGSVSDTAAAQGYSVRSLDANPKLADRVSYPQDILSFDYKKELSEWIPDVVWASPPCTEYSIAKTNAPRDIPGANRIVKRTLEIIAWLLTKNPKLLWIVENPQTGLLKNQPFMRDIPYVDADYCCYGFPYRKRTRFWTNGNAKRLKLCPGPGKCKQMDGNRHILNVGNHHHTQAIRLNDKYRVPQRLVKALLQ